MPVRNRAASYKKGLWSESLACLLLFLKGYRILARRYKTPVGEVDIVAKKNDTITFVEVKARRYKNDALEAISPRNRARVYRAAEYFLSQNPKASGLSMRFDAIIITKSFVPYHLINAWQENDCDFRRVS